MKKLLLILLVTMRFFASVTAQCPPNAYAFLSTYQLCSQGCGVLLKGWPEGVVVNIYGGNPILIITSVVIPGTYGGPGTGNAFSCVPCGIPLIFASAIPGATNGCVIVTLGTVPIKLTNFSLSTTSSNSSLLKWVTYNEAASTTYTIQRSKDSRSFIDINTFTGSGNNINSYSYEDIFLQQGTLFYRIKITDATGKITYSETALIKNQFNLGVSIYPNPVESDFKITIPSQFLPATVTIYNTEGKPVHNLTTLQPTVSVNKRLPKGIYAVRITGNNNSTVTQTLLIK